MRWRALRSMRLGCVTLEVSLPTRPSGRAHEIARDCRSRSHDPSDHMKCKRWARLGHRHLLAIFDALGTSVRECVTETPQTPVFRPRRASALQPAATPSVGSWCRLPSCRGHEGDAPGHMPRGKPPLQTKTARGGTVSAWPTGRRRRSCYGTGPSRRNPSWPNCVAWL
jgi:hypothetical protein